MDNKKIVITGSSSGLGLALAKSLSAKGHSLCLMARTEAKLKSAVETILSAYPSANVSYQAVDVSNAPDLTDAISTAAEKLGGIDVLINNAGVMREGVFESLSNSDFRDIFEINVFGAINGCRAALPFIRQSRGSIVNVGSMASHTGVFGYSAYCAAKHALKGFTESLYHELTVEGITVQLICPPEFDSPMSDALDSNRSPENRAHTLMIPKESLNVVVEETLAAIDRENYQTITGFRTRIFGFLLQHFPSFSRWTAQRTITNCRKQKSH